MYQQYNPYYQQRYPQNMVPTPMPEPAPQQITQPFMKSMLQGKQVDSLDVVKATDVPFDGSVSYFPLTDGSAIITKQLQVDGTSKLVVFKPVNEQNDDIKYITSEDLEKALKSLNLDELEDIKEDIKDLKKQIKRKGE